MPARQASNAIGGASRRRINPLIWIPTPFPAKGRTVIQLTPHLRPSPRSPQCYNPHHNSHNTFQKSPQQPTPDLFTTNATTATNNFNLLTTTARPTPNASTPSPQMPQCFLYLTTTATNHPNNRWLSGHSPQSLRMPGK